MHLPIPSPTIAQRDNGAALAITTTFVPPAQCTQGHLTMLARQQFFVWLNEPVPVAATTVASCYPQQFIQSYTQSMAGNTLPAFSPLVCPQSYQTIVNQDLGGDTPYIVCCPNNYGFAPPAQPNPNRPGAGGTCYSNILSTTVTKYNDDSYSGLIFFSTSGQAYAHPLDGFAFDGQHVATSSAANVAPAQATSAPAVTSQAPTKSPVATSASASATSGTPSISETHNTLPQSASSSSPSQTLSAISVSTAPSSIIPLSTSDGSVIFSTVSPSLITIYTAGPTNTSSTITQPTALLSSTPMQSPALDNGQKAGIAVGAILGALLLGAIAFFLLKRRRKQSEPAEVSDLPPYTFAKPDLADHPSTRGFANEKQLYKSASPTAYYELNSPEMETHELGAGRDGDPAWNAAREMEAPSATKAAQGPTSPIQASPSNPIREET